MADLREKLAKVASEWRQRYKVGNLGVHVEAPDLMLADAILSLPELKEALEWWRERDAYQRP